MSARGRNGFISLALSFIMALSIFSVSGAGAQESSEQVLPGCRIAYPGGYDINTVGIVEGKLLEIQVPDDGPVRLILSGAGDSWVVLTSPPWFWEMAEPRLAPGDFVNVQGSKTLGADGTLYLIAMRIGVLQRGADIVLRDRLGVPLWKNDDCGGRISDRACRTPRGRSPTRRVSPTSHEEERVVPRRRP